MPLNIAQLRDKVAATVDGVFSETVSLEFRAAGGSDPERPDRVIEAVLRTREEAGSRISGSRAGDWKSEVRAGGAQLSVDLTRYPDLKLIKGDVVRAIARAACPKFRVVDVDKRGHHRFVVELADS